MDIKVGGSNRSRPQDGGDGGFSDVLGSVGKGGKGSESGRSGSADTAGIQRGREFGKEFRFAEKAASRAPADRPGEQPGTQGSSFDRGQRPEAQAADEILSEAADMVMQTVRETGGKPDKAEAADMLAQALKTLKSGDENEDVPEEALIDTLMQIFTAIAEEGGVYGTAEAVDEDAVTGITAEFPENVAQTDITEQMPVDITFTAEDETARMSDLQTENAELYEEVGFDAGLRQFVGESVQKLSEGRLSVEAAAAGFETEPEAQTQAMPENIGDLTADETMKLLADLLEEAKKELGLSEIRVEHVYGGEEQEAVPMMRDESAQLSHKMFGKDSTGELDHILSGTRFDVSEDDDNKTDTQTYDAVRMASELMNSRTDTDIPVENEPMFPERTEISPPEIQTAEQILDRIQHMQDDHTEFTMVLNPESLGRITVRIAAAGERMSVEITADDPRTGAMLAARSEGLQNMLRDNGVQLEKCQIVSEHEDTQFNEQSYDGSSKNPYGRSDDGQQSDDDGDGESFYDLLQSI